MEDVVKGPFPLALDIAWTQSLRKTQSKFGTRPLSAFVELN